VGHNLLALCRSTDHQRHQPANPQGAKGHTLSAGIGITFNLIAFLAFAASMKTAKSATFPLCKSLFWVSWTFNTVVTFVSQFFVSYDALLFWPFGKT
jgi:hypothetical protein